MTLLDGLRGACFLMPLMAVYGDSIENPAGAVGIIVRLLVGLGTGVLGWYTLGLIDDYTYRLFERREPGIVKSMLDLSIFISTGIVMLTTSGLAVFITNLIIRYVAP